jgi:heat shock protein HslJ
MPPKRKLYLFILFMVIPLLFTAACTSAEPDGLEDVNWTLEQFGEKGNLKDIIGGSKVTATFDSQEDRIQGSAGCNHYFGGYEAKKGQLSISQIGYTEMYCVGPEGVMDQEHDFLQILQKAESYQVNSDELRIDCGDSELVFISTDE